MLSLDPCGPYLLVPVKENTGVFFNFYFRVVLLKTEKNWEQKTSPIPNCQLVLLRSSQGGDTLQRILKLHLLRRHQSKVHKLVPI